MHRVTARGGRHCRSHLQPPARVFRSPTTVNDGGSGVGRTRSSYGLRLPGVGTRLGPWQTTELIGVKSFHAGPQCRQNEGPLQSATAIAAIGLSGACRLHPHSCILVSCRMTSSDPMHPHLIKGKRRKARPPIVYSPYAGWPDPSHAGSFTLGLQTGSPNGWVALRNTGMGADLGVARALARGNGEISPSRGPPPPSSTLSVVRTTGGGGTINVSVDGAPQAGFTALSVVPACDPGGTGEEVTTGHLIKFVTPGNHTPTWTGTTSGSATVTTSLGHCAYQHT